MVKSAKKYKKSKSHTPRTPETTWAYVALVYVLTQLFEVIRA